MAFASPNRDAAESDAEQRKLWLQLATAVAQEDRARAWLGLLCSRVPGARLGLVVARRSEERFEPIATWAGAGGDPRDLGPLIERALAEGRGLAAEAPGAVRACEPFTQDGDSWGAVAIEASVGPAPLDLTRELRWALPWMQLGARQSEAPSYGTGRLAAALRILTSALDARSFASAAQAVVTEVALELRCDRVSLGIARGGSVRVAAISHTAEFAAEMNLVRAIERAMGEASASASPVRQPPADPDASVESWPEHAELARLDGFDALLSVVDRAPQGSRVTLTLERASAAFATDEVEHAVSLAALLGPVLELRRRGDRTALRWLAESARDAFARALGPERLGLKLAAATLVLGLALSLLVRIDFRVTAEAVLEGSVQRSINAPFDGYVASTLHRAGDVVRAGDELARLDDRDLLLEKLRGESQRLQLRRRSDEARALGERAELRLLSAQLEQAEAQLALVEQQLERTRITAPFDGVIISGDLTQQLGASLVRGQELFVLAPLESWRVILKVSERDIDRLEPGQSGALVLASRPDESFPIAVRTLTPIATAEEGLNYFRVEAELEGETDRLRPGMEGVGKVEIARRSLLWIATRDLVDWIRLWSWKWLP